MSPELESILNRLDVQLNNMSPEEYKKQLDIINEMNDGPTAEDLIKSFQNIKQS